MESMDDLLKNLNDLKASLLQLQANTDELLRNAPKDELKKSFIGMSEEELQRVLEYFVRHQNFEVCQAIKEVIAERGYA